MTFDELKRDLKDQDGDPQARSRRRGLHRSIARGAIERTREASFVVTNPTHVAIALRYAPPEVPVPEILVRAVDAAALAVRAIAERERIPIVENVALARWLLRVGENGAPIPAETFVAVAEVIAALLRAGVLAV
jgi:type III secretion protein U